MMKTGILTLKLRSKNSVKVHLNNNLLSFLLPQLILHRPEEYSSPEAISGGIEVLARTLYQLAE